MPNPLLRRCIRYYTCRTHSGNRRGAAVTFNARRGLALAPRPPHCIACGAPMVRVGSSYQALLDPAWDPAPKITRRLYSAMISRRA